MLDECFESLEQALEAASAWLEHQGQADQRGDQRERDWRTLRHAGLMGWR